MTTKNKTGEIALALGVLAILLFRFGRYFQGYSYDLAQHFLLTDEIMKYGGIRPGDIPSMWMYPDATHWIAAVVGWVGGTSGLVGITLVSITSVYLSYLLIIRLIGTSLVRVLVFALAFMLLRHTMSLIGWEVVRNYFYSQLVTDVLYFSVLLWMASNPAHWKVVVALLGISWFTMYAHSLVPLHLLGTGCVLMTFQFLLERNDKVGRRTAAFSTVVLIVGALVIVAMNPALKQMAGLALNDGWLDFGYTHILLIAFLCAVPGVWNLYRHWKGVGEHVDAVIGSSVIAAVCLVFMQFTALKFHGDGSAYAVKKHMFIVMTLAVLNIVRAVPAGAWKINPGVVAPILAGFASFVVLRGFNTPVAPVVRALNYADTVVDYHLPNFRRGDFVADDDTLPTMGNWMITMGSFGHAYDKQSISWQSGTPIKDGAKYVMVSKAWMADKKCKAQFAEAPEYMIVEPPCFTSYNLGASLKFSDGGNGIGSLGHGWSNPEPWGVWSDGSTEAEIILEIPKGEPDLHLDIEAQGYILPKHDRQKVEVEVNGVTVTSWVFDAHAPVGTYTATIPADLVKDGAVKISFRTPGAVSPQGIGESIDRRVIGVGLKSITLYR